MNSRQESGCMVNALKMAFHFDEEVDVRMWEKRKRQIESGADMNIDPDQEARNLIDLLNLIGINGSVQHCPFTSIDDARSIATQGDFLFLGLPKSTMGVPHIIYIGIYGRFVLDEMIDIIKSQLPPNVAMSINTHLIGAMNQRGAEIFAIQSQ